MVMNYPSEVQMQINARINGKYSDVVQTEADLRLIYNRDDATLQYRLEASLEPHLNISLNNSVSPPSASTSSSESQRTHIIRFITVCVRISPSMYYFYYAMPAHWHNNNNPRRTTHP